MEGVRSFDLGLDDFPAQFGGRPPPGQGFCCAQLVAGRGMVQERFQILWWLVGPTDTVALATSTLPFHRLLYILLRALKSNLAILFCCTLDHSQDLKDFARQAGNVIRADVDRNMPGEGLIEYSSQDDADNALRKLDGTDLKGSVVTVYEDRPGGGGGGRRDRSRSPSHRDRGDRDRDRRGGYDRDRRRSPPSRDDRERDRGYERKERDRSREPRERSRERSVRRETVDEVEKV